MPDYAKMYFLLCAAVDRSLDELQRIPLAAPAAALLQNALLQAEAIYIETSPTLPEQAPLSPTSAALNKKAVRQAPSQPPWLPLSRLSRREYPSPLGSL